MDKTDLLIQVNAILVELTDVVGFDRCDKSAQVFAAARQKLVGLAEQYADELERERAEVLVLLNEHLKGRVYTDLDDAVRNLLQVYITMRDNKEDDRRKSI